MIKKFCFFLLFFIFAANIATATIYQSTEVSIEFALVNESTVKISATVKDTNGNPLNTGDIKFYCSCGSFKDGGNQVIKGISTGEAIEFWTPTSISQRCSITATYSGSRTGDIIYSSSGRTEFISISSLGAVQTPQTPATTIPQTIQPPTTKPPPNAPPSISITSPASSQTITTNTLTISGTASDDNQVAEVWLYVGGKWEDLKITPAKTVTFSKTVTLSEGDTFIYAWVKDSGGLTRDSNGITITYKAPPPETPAPTTQPETITPTPKATQPSRTAPPQTTTPPKSVVVPSSSTIFGYTFPIPYAGWAIVLLFVNSIFSIFIGNMKKNRNDDWVFATGFVGTILYLIEFGSAIYYGPLPAWLQTDYGVLTIFLTMIAPPLIIIPTIPYIYRLISVPAQLAANIRKRRELKIKEEEKERRRLEARKLEQKQAIPSLAEKYILMRNLGEGGFGVVKKAKRRSDGEIVALKLPKALTQKGMDNFLQEVGIWRVLRGCENVVRFNEAGVAMLNDALQPYIEMELGEYSLRNKIPTKPDEACTVMFEVLSGLAFAHSSNILHMDLKPENILFVNSKPKISDFGLSKLKSSKYSKGYVGTVHYSAPEQFSSKRFGGVDKRTDVYQIGVVFYELLTGILPFEGEDDGAYMNAVINEEPKSLKKLNSSVPQDLEKIVMKCLSKEKEDRYEDAEELRNALAEYLKIEYTSKLRMSKGNMRRSADYCCELFLLHAKLGEASDALRYCLDMKQYAGEGIISEVDNLAKELEYRLKEGIKISEEFLEKARVIAHQVRMGWK